VRGTVIGLPMPMCSCGVIPLYRSLVLQGVPTPAALSFLISAPELGVTAVFLSLSLLGTEITIARALCAAVLALLVGLIVGRRAPVSEPIQAPAGSQEKLPLARRVRSGIAYGLGDMVDATAPWILVGLGLAALLEPWLSAEGISGLPPALEVLIFALIGMPLYVCASGSTPLAVVLIAKGVSPGAAIAFLLTGPATNVTTFGVIAKLHSRRTALFFAGTTAVVTTLLGLGVNAFLTVEPGALAEHVHGGDGGLLEPVCAVALLAIFAVSLLRQGTRRFVGQVISPHGASEHDHDHDHHDHDEGHEHGHVHAHAEQGHACCHAPAPARAD
jgi:uncharacterized membrane protein YraQ (UPF0718 family)